VRLEFGHALAQWVAERTGSRVLHIKGMAAQAVLPVEDALSFDVDVLVHPDDFRTYVDTLASLTTTELIDDGARSAEAHAVEIVSRGLEISLDVHAHFPGFRADHDVVFDRLAARSAPVDFAGVSCACLDRVGLASLGVVHAARNAKGGRSARLALQRWDLLDASEREQAVDLIGELGAAGAAHSVTGAHPEASRRDVALFLAYQRRARPTTLWLLTLLATRGVRARWSIVRRAASTRSSMVTGSAPLAPQERRSRWRRLIAAGPPATREVVSILREVRGRE